MESRKQNLPARSSVEAGNQERAHNSKVNGIENSDEKKKEFIVNWLRYLS